MVSQMGRGEVPQVAGLQGAQCPQGFTSTQAVRRWSETSKRPGEGVKSNRRKQPHAMQIAHAPEQVPAERGILISFRPQVYGLFIQVASRRAGRGRSLHAV